MSLHEKAFELAAEGRTNADIFGALEITSSALAALLQIDPKVIFGILAGRAEFTKPFVEVLSNLASGWGEELGPKPNLSAIQLLLDRMDRNNQSLMAAYDLTMLAGTSTPSTSKIRDSGTVTSLLRAAK